MFEQGILPGSRDRRLVLCVMGLIAVHAIPAASGCSAEARSLGGNESGGEQTAKSQGALVVTEEAKLVPGDGKTSDDFGASVGISGETAVIGAYRNASAPGGAYVFVRSGGAWTQQAELVSNDSQDQDELGRAVSISGDTIVVGAPGMDVDEGAAYVFVRTGDAWTQQARLVADDIATPYGDRFGGAVVVEGDTAIVGADARDGHKGAAYVFERSGTSWMKKAKLAGSDGTTNEWFGFRVGLSGDTAVIGATEANGTAIGSGAAYVFVRDAGAWLQQARLTAPGGASSDQFGSSVAVSGDTAIIGASGNDGAAHVFVRDGATWSHQAKLSGKVAEDFGISVSLAGDRAIVGAWLDANDTGEAYVFLRKGTEWVQTEKLAASDGVPHDRFGLSVAQSGDTTVISAIGESDNTGSAYVYRLTKGALGHACHVAAECESGFCADGVCCNEECGASSMVDCQGCSVAVGAAVDGTCGVIADGTGCADDDACTTGEHCVSGACTGGNPVTCKALDECHDPGTCDPASGCSNPPKQDGTGCDDANACTKTDVCKAGVCMGSDFVACSNEGCRSESCEPPTGHCSETHAKDGQPCAGGVCQYGVCVVDADAGGTGGSSGSTGEGGSAGTQTGGSAGAAGPSEDTSDSGGCGCRTGGRHSASFGWIGLGIAAVMAARRRRMP